MVILHSAAADPRALLMPFFAGPSKRQDVHQELILGCSMRPPRRASDHLSLGIDRSWTSRTPMAIPAYVLGQLARHRRAAGNVGEGGNAAEALGEIVASLSALDRTFRFGVATDSEIEQAIRIATAAPDIARGVGGQQLNRDFWNFGRAVREIHLPALARAIPAPDAEALAGLADPG